MAECKQLLLFPGRLVISTMLCCLIEVSDSEPVHVHNLLKLCCLSCWLTPDMFSNRCHAVVVHLCCTQHITASKHIAQELCQEADIDIGMLI